MKTMILHRLGFHFDHARQLMVFNGQLEDGYQFEVGFPIGHVALTFDREAAALGWIGEPIMGGDYVTIEGFFGSLARAASSVGRAVGGAVAGAAKAVAKPAATVAKAYANTVQKVAKQAVHYARAAAKTVGPVFQSALSMVPGVGTLASMGLGAMSGVLQGKSLTEIGKMVATGAIPGGPLVVALATTAANVAIAGVQGKNLVNAARTELVNAAVSQVPVPQAQAILRDAANAALSGQNVLKSAKASLINQALNQIPDPSARELARAALSGAKPADIINKASPKMLTQVAAQPNAKTGTLLAAVVASAGQPAVAKKSVSQAFPAIGANGLAAFGAGTRAASVIRSKSGLVSPLRSRVASLALSRQPAARMTIAGLRSTFF